MAELADAPDLGSGSVRNAGSSPVTRTTGSGGARLWRRHCFLSLKMIFLYEFTASSKASLKGDFSMEYLFFSSEKISENFSPKMLTFRPLYHILPM